ncbi:MAG: hypothetical protein V4507_15335, partial [Verrucomicrobiota bacterium]
AGAKGAPRGRGAMGAVGADGGLGAEAALRAAGTGGFAINGAGAFNPDSERGGRVIFKVSDFTGVPVGGVNFTPGFGLFPEGAGGTGKEFSDMKITYAILRFLQLKNRNHHIILSI